MMAESVQLRTQDVVRGLPYPEPLGDGRHVKARKETVSLVVLSGRKVVEIKHVSGYQ